MSIYVSIQPTNISIAIASCEKSNDVEEVIAVKANLERRQS
jgi:hypothetical protein